MKKVTTLKVISIIFFAILGFSFFSCQGFMSGNELANKINDEIDAANAPYIEFEMQKGDGGTVSPIGRQSVKCKTEFTISYEKDNDYQFVKWQALIDDKVISAEEAEKYITFSDTKKELTTVKLNAEIPGKLVIKPLCYERPVILGKTPTETPEGSYRDARISIMFSKAMDESSIYYNSIDDIPEGAIPKYIDGNKNNKIYGYTLNGETYFKNIEIKNIDTQESLLDCFRAPYFESPTRITIPVENGKEPKSGSQILVTISKNMCILVEETPVTLIKNEIWNYLVNSKTDSDVPIFESIELKKKDFNSNTYTGLNYCVLDGNFNKTTVEDLYLNKNDLGLILKCKDLGSGVNSVVMKLQRVFDSHYKKIENSEIEQFPLPLSYTSGKNKAMIYEGYDDETVPYDLSLNGWVNGIYKVWFTITDINGNSIDSVDSSDLSDSMKYFYVLKADAAIDITTIKAIPQNKGVKFMMPENKYLGKKATVIYKNKTNTSIEQNITKTLDADDNGVFILNGLQNCAVYGFTVTFEDIFGNTTATVTKEVMTAPAAPVVNKVGVYNGPQIPSECQVFDITGESFNINEDTVYYGRGIELTPPTVLNDYTLKYRVYEGNKIIQDNISSKDFDLAYSETEGEKTYTVAAYIEYESEVVEGEKSAEFTYHERNVDGIFVDTVYSTRDRFGISAGFISRYDNNKAGSAHRFRYGKWERYAIRSGNTFYKQKTDGTNMYYYGKKFSYQPAYISSDKYFFDYTRDICEAVSNGCSYVYRMQRDETEQDNDVLFAFTFEEENNYRNVVFLWDGYTVY